MNQVGSRVFHVWNFSLKRLATLDPGTELRNCFDSVSNQDHQHTPKDWIGSREVNLTLVKVFFFTFLKREKETGEDLEDFFWGKQCEHEGLL